MLELINKLIEENKKVSTMESCTGGMLASEITNIPNASQVFNFGVVTYANEEKIRFGVPREIIDKYSVYSNEVASSMAKVVSLYANSNYGIGVTGNLKKMDENNLVGDDDIVYFCIYDRDHDLYYNEKVKVDKLERKANKMDVINKIVDKMLSILK